MDINWVKEFGSAVTICDKNGIILYMNEKAALGFLNDGGYNLIGTNLFDCHSEQSVILIKKLLSEGESNSYTIEKNGIKKFIHQSPWYENGELMGLVEISIEIPFEMPHHLRG